MFTVAWLFLKSLDWRIYAAVAAIGAVLWYGHSQRLKERAEWETKIEQAHQQRRAEVAEFVVGMSARNTALKADLDRERGTIKTETVTLQKEVTRYVTAAADARCIVPVGFVRHFDAAWGLSALPAAASGLIDDPSGIPLSVVESVNTGNASSAREWRSEALGWRKWYGVHAEKFTAFASKTDPRATAGKPVEKSSPTERK